MEPDDGESHCIFGCEREADPPECIRLVNGEIVTRIMPGINVFRSNLVTGSIVEMEGVQFIFFVLIRSLLRILQIHIVFVPPNPTNPD